ncbi:MAG: AMP-dependent synthetase/ligase [Spirochaetaceae bacterium]
MSQPWDFLDDYRQENESGVVLANQWPTLPELFEITVHRYADRRAFTTFDPEEMVLTYREVHRKILATAAELSKRKIKPGDFVALTGKNSPEWAVAYLAVLFAGGIIVPIDYQLDSEDIVGLAGRARAKLIFVDTERYEEVKPLKVPRISLAPDQKDYIFDLPEKDFDRVLRQPSEPAAILFTSGTTGHAKGVVLSHENLTSDCLLAQANLGIYHTDIFYAVLPLHHSYSMLAVFIEAISVGAEIVFAKRLAVTQMLEELKRARVTMLLGIPLLFNKLLKGIMRGVKQKGPIAVAVVHTMLAISSLSKTVFRKNIGKKLFHSILEKASLASIRICISGGGPLPAKTFRRFNQLGLSFVQGYGLTETSPILTLNPTYKYKVHSVGKVLPQTTLKILAPDGRGRGEIAAQGPMIMKGYFEDEEATRAVMTDDGFFRTGDVGYLDDDNYLYLSGRAKSLIVTSGGKNVYPEEIEDEFQLYDEVDQILVRGYMRDKKMREEDIEALVYPDLDLFAERHGTKGSEPNWDAIQERLEEIVAEVNKRLQPYQRISRVKPLSAPMEMTTTKKIKRHEVDA